MASCIDPTKPGAPPRTPASLLGWLLNSFRERGRRRQTAKELARLGERELRDIGINRHDIATIVDTETGKFRPDEFRSRF